MRWKLHLLAKWYMLLSSNLLIQHPEMLYSFGQKCWAEMESWLFNRNFCRPVCDYVRNLEQVHSIYEMCHSEFYVKNEDAIFAFVSFAANMGSIEWLVSVWQSLFLIILMPPEKESTLAVILYTIDMNVTTHPNYFGLLVYSIAQVSKKVYSTHGLILLMLVRASIQVQWGGSL